jgi:uncharacterized protein YjbI with pentapeptide repeats
VSTDRCNVRMRMMQPCGRSVARGAKCIFHLEKKTDKEAQRFDRAFAKELERLEKSKEAVIDLTGFVFPRDLDMSDHSFPKPVVLSRATFSGSARFHRTKFLDRAWFDGATFSVRAGFKQVTFSRDAWFRHTIFKDHAGFHGATFSDHAGFHAASFLGWAGFDGATFSGYVAFDDATFSDDAVFDGATFGKVVFHGTNFRRNLQMGARFDGPAIFENVLFQRDTIESSDLATVVAGSSLFPVTSFGGAFVSEGGEVRFIQQREYNAPLGVERNFGIDRVSFLNVNLGRFNFQEVEWGTLHGRRAVIEEAMMGRRPFENVTPEQVRQIYARLRANQEKAFRYAEAGDFFIGEMDMRRRWLRDRGWQAFPERFLLWLFSGLSRYGESISRPTLAMVIVVFGLAGLRLVLGEQSEWRLCQPLSVEESLVRSLASFFQLRSTTLWTDILERLVSIPILGVLFIALRRKLERRS